MFVEMGQSASSMWKKKEQQATILNGRPPTPGIIRQVRAAVLDPGILTEKGGYIFKAALADDILHIGLLPTIIGDVRNVHHAINLHVDVHLIINGFFNVDGTLGMILLKPGEKPCLTAEDRPAARRLMIRFCQCLQSWNLPDELPLDTITELMLHEAGLSTENPSTLKQLLTAL